MEERVSRFLPLAYAPSLAEQSVDLDKIALLRCRDFLNQVKVKVKAEREVQVMVSLDLSLYLQSRVRRELWQHE